MAYGALDIGRWSAEELSPDETDRQKISDTLPGVGNQTTKCNFGTNGAVRWFRCIPLNGTGTDMGAATPPFAWANVGWKMDPDDMGATSGLKRVILAGDWEFRTSLVTSLTNATAKFGVEVWRVASGGASATLIFSAQTVDTTILLAGTAVTLTKTGVAEQVFADGETLMVEVYIQSNGLTIVGHTVTFQLATTTSNQINWPGVLQNRAPLTLSATCTAGAAFGPRKIGKRRFATVTAAATMTRHLVLHRTFGATVTAAASMARRLTLHRTFAASVTAVATMVKRVRLPRIASVTATATMQRKIGKPLSASVTAIATMQKKVSKSMVASVTAFATLARALRLSRRMDASVTAVARARAQLAFEDVPGDGGGGTTIIGVSRSRVTGGV